MTQFTTKAHIVRAALEGISYQTREVIYQRFLSLFPIERSIGFIH